MEKIREAIAQTVTQIEETSSQEVKEILIDHLKHLVRLEKATLGYMETSAAKFVER